MLQILSLVALCVSGSLASAIIPAPSISLKGLSERGVAPLGVVSPVSRCGGVGTPLQLRISECEGKCELKPGTVYNCEKDFMPGKRQLIANY